MSKEIALETKIDNYIKEYKTGAALIIGGISIVNSITTEVKPESKDYFFKWLDGVLGPVVIQDIIGGAMNTKVENDILDMINTTMFLIHRADLILNKVFQQISNSQGFVQDFLAVVQSYLEIEKMYNEKTLKKHQKFVDTIYKEDFKLNKEQVRAVKDASKLLVSKLKEGGINFDAFKSPN